MEQHERIAVNAVLSMLLEVSANPKPGNVDREHDFDDLRYEDFLISSASSFPVFLKIARNELSIGEGIYLLVRETSEFHKAGNVHFGAFLLLTPLVYAHGSVSKAHEVIKSTTHLDSKFVKKAFEVIKPRVMDSENIDLRDDVDDVIEQKKLNLYEWMKLAPEDNFIAKEYVNGFELSLRGSKMLIDLIDVENDINRATVHLHVIFLSELLDPLIIAKKGYDYAKKVRDMAQKTLQLYTETRNLAIFEELDRKLVSMNANPGSIADLVISSLFLTLCRGVRI